MGFEARAKAFKAMAARRSALGPRSRYTAQMRSEGSRYAAERIAVGASVAAITRELGLGPGTLQRWLADEQRPATFRQVQVVDTERQAEPAGAGLVVHGPFGLRIEVRDLGALAELLRRLG